MNYRLIDVAILAGITCAVFGMSYPDYLPYVINIWSICLLALGLYAIGKRNK